MQIKQESEMKKPKYGIVSLILGGLAIGSSPTILALMYFSETIFFSCTILSLILATIAFLFGLLAFKRLKDKLGIVGMVLGTIDAIITVVLPFLYVIITPFVA